MRDIAERELISKRIIINLNLTLHYGYHLSKSFILSVRHVSFLLLAILHYAH